MAIIRKILHLPKFLLRLLTSIFKPIRYLTYPSRQASVNKICSKSEIKSIYYPSDTNKAVPGLNFKTTNPSYLNCTEKLPEKLKLTTDSTRDITATEFEDQSKQFPNYSVCPTQFSRETDNCVQYSDTLNMLKMQQYFPRLSVFNVLFMMGIMGVFFHSTVTYIIIYPAFRLVFGTLYPAYASYKAVKTKNVKEYVKWMMYWIVFALFTCTETITDIFLSWFPFYYEIKIILVIWLLSPATKGSSILYRKFVHPMLSSREQEIDEYISKAKEQSYRQVLDLGQKGVTVLMQTAIKSVTTQKLVSALSQASLSGEDEPDGVVKNRSQKRRLEVDNYQSKTEEYLYNDDDFRFEAEVEQGQEVTITEEDVFEVPEPKAPKGGGAKGKGKKGVKTSTKGTKRTTRSTPRTDEGESSDF